MIIIDLSVKGTCVPDFQLDCPGLKARCHASWKSVTLTIPSAILNTQEMLMRNDKSSFFELSPRGALFIYFSSYWTLTLQVLCKAPDVYSLSSNAYNSEGKSCFILQMSK